MIRHGIKGAVGGGAATLQEGPIQAYQDAALRAGHDWKLGENLTVGIFFHLADSKEQAIKELTPYYEEHVKMFGPLGFVPGITPEQIEASSKRGNWAAANVPTIEHFMDLGAWFAGTPEQLVERLKEMEARYPGMEHINLSTAMGTPKSVMLEQFQRISEEVMPHFQGR
jgi:alkanesulfonate monooxygenase SsuD/methylene tetrahydromethanopterin reductase-like flavin-dependent oxidoreductase (luciferase family)